MNKLILWSNYCWTSKIKMVKLQEPNLQSQDLQENHLMLKQRPLQHLHLWKILLLVQNMLQELKRESNLLSQVFKMDHMVQLKQLSLLLKSLLFISKHQRCRDQETLNFTSTETRSKHFILMMRQKLMLLISQMTLWNGFILDLDLSHHLQLSKLISSYEIIKEINQNSESVMQSMLYGRIQVLKMLKDLL